MQVDTSAIRMGFCGATSLRTIRHVSAVGLQKGRMLSGSLPVFLRLPARAHSSPRRMEGPGRPCLSKLVAKATKTLRCAARLSTNH
jgi:hypothetical protein